jgi:hypothetical protein
MTRATESFSLPTVRFLAEQKGPTESILTKLLSDKLAMSGLVHRAYLVRATYGQDATCTSIVLAIRTHSGGEERSLLPSVNAAFASIFGAHEHLDILFVRENQEEAIRKVCQAFYFVPGDTVDPLSPQPGG